MQHASMPDDAPTLPTLVPVCPADGMRMTQTIVGWRCPICGAPARSLAA